ncbi:hypothetical protein HOP50_16g77810 [Chloropicon primus]|nr:hypothetical protein HOP50_16g77810 [Chloropicon primus]
MARRTCETRRWWSPSPEGLTKARPPRPPRPEVSVASSSSSFSSVVLGLSEAASVVALSLACLRYQRANATSRELMLPPESPAPLLDDGGEEEEEEEREQIELVSSLFLSALSLTPLVNWLPWVLAARTAAVVAGGQEAAAAPRGRGSAPYYACLAALYGAPSAVGLLGGSLGLGWGDLPLLLLGAAHLQVERAILREEAGAREGAQRQWIEFARRREQESGDGLGDAGVLLREDEERKRLDEILGGRSDALQYSFDDGGGDGGDGGDLEGEALAAFDRKLLGEEEEEEEKGGGRRKTADS